MQRLVVSVFVLVCTLFLAVGEPREAEAQAYSEVDAAIDSVGLPPIFHTIAWNESGDNPYVINPVSGACGPFQFLPYIAGHLGYTCGMLTNPWIAAEAALALYYESLALYGNGLQPWGY
jgi:Transglycosylase SLT domain